MAGQPQEPPWQSFPTAAVEKQDSYSYPPPPAAPSASQGGQGGQGDLGYGQASYDQTSYDQASYDQGSYDQGSYGQSSYGQQAGQGYPGPTYSSADQGGYQGAQDQAYQSAGAQDQGYPGPQGQPTPSWQSAQGFSAATAARAQDHAKGFFGALFDFSFTSFVTPKLVKVLYVLITIWTVLWALIFLRYGFKYGGAVGGFFTLLIVDPIMILLILGAWRVVLELFMVVHNLHDNVKAIRERGDRM